MVNIEKKSLNFIGHNNDVRGIPLSAKHVGQPGRFSSTVHTGLLTDRLRSNAKIINSRDNTIGTYFTNDEAIAKSTVLAHQDIKTPINIFVYESVLATREVFQQWVDNAQPPLSPFSKHLQDNELQFDTYARETSLSLSRERTGIEHNWGRIKERSISMCQEILGRKKYHHKDWIPIETTNRIRERKNKKTAINNSRTRTQKSKQG
ncbi:unnamed protein product [Schistosoma margrebowiei]|uniref:Uncharacterized protein n=1 Tax=Schistosoma margrebowiei TaxID=48269 RepID=A0A183L9J8_9TREM|nr:unnamed protein product [Schistosoma margrebowiei]